MVSTVIIQYISDLCRHSMFQWSPLSSYSISVISTVIQYSVIPTVIIQYFSGLHYHHTMFQWSPLSSHDVSVISTVTQYFSDNHCHHTTFQWSPLSSCSISLISIVITISLITTVITQRFVHLRCHKIFQWYPLYSYTTSLMALSSRTFQHPPLNGAYHCLISGVDTRCYIYSCHL